MKEYEDLNPLDNIDDVIEKKEQERIFNEMSKIDGLHELFRAMMARDMRMHFNVATDKERDMCRGAFSRMEYLAKRVKNTSLDIKS